MSLTAVLPILSTVIEKIFPDKDKADLAKLELIRLQQTGELAMLAAATDIAKGQIEINVAEAQSDGAFKSGWRPAAGWVCVLGLLYNFIAQPLLTWLSRVYGFDAPPQLDIQELMALLFGMLGLGGLRTHEKIRKAN